VKKVSLNSDGTVDLKSTDNPHIETFGTIVKTQYALISTGTETSKIKSKIESSKSPIKRVLFSKDFRSKVLKFIKKTSIKTAIRKAKKELTSQPRTKNFQNPSTGIKPLGYSCSGVVIKSNIEEFSINQKVACAGSHHAQLIYSPKNMTAKIPDKVNLKEAAFATIGSIALHGIHNAKLNSGEYVGVIGTGLIGLITVQLAKISGGITFAFDLMNTRLDLAKKLGAEHIINPASQDSKRLILDNTNGRGLDKIIICAASKTSKPLLDAVGLVRDRGRIVILGNVPINIDREILYQKEISLIVSRSYGPGRYDPEYEYYAKDYPKDYVPYTIKRNMEIIMDLIAEHKLDVDNLISQIYPAEKVNEAYEKLISEPENIIAILLDFSKYESGDFSLQEKEPITEKHEKLNIGLIGCGSFAKKVHIPFLQNDDLCHIRAICTNHKSSAKSCENTYHPDYVTTDYKKLLKDPQITTIFIYTRHNTHAKFAIEALEASKNVFSEKPMGINREECEKIYEVWKGKNLTYTIGFNRRCSPLIQKAKTLLQDITHPIVINYRIASNFIDGNHWVFDPHIGGGPIIGEFCHFTDLILYLIGDKPIELTATGGSLSHVNTPTYETAVVVLKFQNGSIANLIYSDLNHPNIPKERIEIFSGNSALLINDFKTMITEGFDDGNYYLTEQDKGYRNELNNIIRSNLGQDTPFVGIKDALRAMDLCFKTLESIHTKKTILIEDELYSN